MDVYSTSAPGLYCMVSGYMILPMKTLYLATAVP